MKTTTEVAAILGVSKRYIQRLIQIGRLPAVKWSRDWMIEEHDVASFERRPVGRPKRQRAAKDA